MSTRRRPGHHTLTAADSPRASSTGLCEEQTDRLTELMMCVAGGDESCFEELYGLLVPRIFGLVKRIIVSSAHAEEVTQEIFLEVWQKARSYDSSQGSVHTWVTVLAHRRAVDRVRSVQSAQNRDIAQGALAFRETYEHVHETVEQHLESESVTRALADLPRDQLDIVGLAYFGGVTQREIAQQLGIPLGTVKSKLRAALMFLRTRLGDTHASSG